MAEGKTKVAVLMTTFNRKKYTVKAVESLISGNPSLDMRFIVTDDHSSDDTVSALKSLNIRLKIINGDGSLFWNGGMRKSMDYALRHTDSFDYCLLINDDVDFYEGAIESLIHRLEEGKVHAVVGETSDSNGKTSYGGVRKLSKHFAKFELIDPSKKAVLCDTFNCNCVLMTAEAFKEAGNLDPHYVHSMGDYDYGMHLNKLGFIVINSEEYVGSCQDNDISKTWRNPLLPRGERLKLKEGPKGLPKKDWFYFVKKNYGLLPALYHSVTPYIRILIKK